MEHLPFLVWKRPRVYWDPDLQGKNLEFLRGISPSYYEHIAESQEPYLSGEDRETCLNAAAAVRIAYGQGLETLMALLCATMQAPACVVGWMHQYRNSELQQMVEAVSKGTASPYVLTGFRPTSWETLSRAIYARVQLEDEGKREFLSEGFARLWERFARDFLAETSIQEYNALKHGSRPKMGGFSMAMGLQKEAGVPAEKFFSLGGSKYGSTFFTAESLALNGLHARPRRQSVNWMPENLTAGLGMIALSLTNVTAYLRSLSGDDAKDCQFFGPDEAEAFDEPWSKHPGVTSSSFDLRITGEHIMPWTREEVDAMIREHYPASS